MNKNKKGFTLVELLVVIAILAILAAVGIVSYKSFIDDANDSAALQEATQVQKVCTALDAKDGKIDGKCLDGSTKVDVTTEVGTDDLLGGTINYYDGDRFNFTAANGKIVDNVNGELEIVEEVYTGE